jgi:hypothetical protein
MENRVEIVDGSEAREESVEVEVSEERIEVRVVVGSDESKDLDGEEVFEEAMSTPKLLQEQLFELRREIPNEDGNGEELKGDNCQDNESGNSKMLELEFFQAMRMIAVIRQGKFHLIWIQNIRIAQPSQIVRQRPTKIATNWPKH